MIKVKINGEWIENVVLMEEMGRKSSTWKVWTSYYSYDIGQIQDIKWVEDKSKPSGVYVKKMDKDEPEEIEELGTRYLSADFYFDQCQDHEAVTKSLIDNFNKLKNKLNEVIRAHNKKLKENNES